MKICRAICVACCCFAAIGLAVSVTAYIPRGDPAAADHVATPGNEQTAAHPLNVALPEAAPAKKHPIGSPEVSNVVSMLADRRRCQHWKPYVARIPQGIGKDDLRMLADVLATDDPPLSTAAWRECANGILVSILHASDPTQSLAAFQDLATNINAEIGVRDYAIQQIGSMLASAPSDLRPTMESFLVSVATNRTQVSATAVLALHRHSGANSAVESVVESLLKDASHDESLLGTALAVAAERALPGAEAIARGVAPDPSAPTAQRLSAFAVLATMTPSELNATILERASQDESHVIAKAAALWLNRSKERNR